MNRWDDHYARRARAQGYAARSVYKLEEIQRRFHVLSRGAATLDLGAAPGSWTQFVLERFGGPVCAVDLQPMSPVAAGAASKLQADLFAAETVAWIEERGPFQVVLSDAAPSTTGSRTLDSSASAELVGQALAIADRVLAPGGNLVAKLLQGGQEQQLLQEMRRRFGRVKGFKPEASRKASSEVFLIGLGFDQKKP